MGCVWVAHNEVLDVQVAIKLLHEQLQRGELEVRLVQEARLAARVEHRNIVRVHDLGFTAWRAPYIVMELLDGQDLRDELLEHGAMTPIAAVRTLLPVLEGLAYAHDRGVIHRDLKPENIFLARAGGLDCVIPKLVDFGIARSLVGPASERRITRRGSIFGSINYLSPEQAVGSDDVDARADLWAFCAVLFECVTARAAFDGDDYGQVLPRIIRGEVESPAALGVDDGGLWPIIARGLTRDCDERWQDARSLGQAMTEWLAVQGVDEDMCGSSTRTRWFGSVVDEAELNRGSAPALPPAASLPAASLPSAWLPAASLPAASLPAASLPFALRITVLNRLRECARNHPLGAAVLATSLGVLLALTAWAFVPTSAEAHERVRTAHNLRSHKVVHQSAQPAAPVSQAPQATADAKASQRVRASTEKAAPRLVAVPSQPRTAAPRRQTSPNRYDPNLGF
jgi:serine/threonine-protein kinase